MLAGISHGIIQRSADAYIPSTPPVFQTLRMSDALQGQLFLSASGRIIPQQQSVHLRQITVDIPGQILTGMIKYNNGKQSHSSINDG
jgi:hypothetical protein